MKHEIGGYFELETFNNPLYHSQGVYLNSSRNALRYIIKANNITEIYLPAYTCEVVFDAVKSENCKINYYHIDKNFMPTTSLPANAYIIYNNYFGICSTHIDILEQKYPRLIIDNAQSFYSMPKAFASFYSPRKFFGLPDGGIAFSSKKINDTLETDISYERCTHLLKRYDLGANNAYAECKKSEASLENQPIKQISKLTMSMMGNINYASAKQKRCENFAYLHNSLKNSNELTINLTKNDVPMVYPLLIKNDVLRKKLIDNKIYVATYWPNIENIISDDEKYLQKYLLPLPIDQRYGLYEIQKIIDIIGA